MPKVVDESRIFQAALDALMARGYEGATTKEIAATSGVNEATLFRRYGSKGDLFVSAIERRLADTPLNHLEYSGDLAADMTAIVEAYLKTVQTYGDVVAIILVEVPRNPELQPATDTPLRNLQPAIEIIRRHQSEGRLRGEAPLAALIALIGPLMVSRMYCNAKPNMANTDIDPAAHADAYLRGRAEPRSDAPR